MDESPTKSAQAINRTTYASKLPSDYYGSPGDEDENEEGLETHPRFSKYVLDEEVHTTETN